MRRKNNAVNRFDWSHVDIVKLRQWWLDPKRDIGEFFTEFGITYERIYASRKKLMLPPRPRQWRQNVDDPTPEEIAKRAAECREQHYADVRKYGQPEPQPAKMITGGHIKDPTPFKMFCDGVL